MVLIKEENVAKYRRYIVDISRIGGKRHDISRRYVGGVIFRKKSPKNQRLAINHRFMQKIAWKAILSSIFWRFLAKNHLSLSSVI